MKIKVIRFLFLLFLFINPVIIFAQPDPPEGGEDPCWPPPCSPIDGGISLLIAAGAVYGGKVLKDNFKPKGE